MDLAAIITNLEETHFQYNMEKYKKLEKERRGNMISALAI